MAYDFDGTDDYMQALSAPVTAAPLTMACWFNVDNITARHTLICLTDGIGSDQFILEADGTVAGDPIRARTFAGGSFSNAVSATGFSATTWHHCAARFISATNRRAYIDGVGGTANTVSRTPTGIDETVLGAAYASSALGLYTNGRIAEAAIWNTDLTDDEIAALAKGFRPSLIRPASLRLYVPLVREVADYSRAVSLTTSGPVVAVHPRRIA